MLVMHSRFVFLLVLGAVTISECRIKKKGNKALTLESDDLYNYDNISLEMDPQIEKYVTLKLFIPYYNYAGSTITKSNAAKQVMVQNGTTLVIIHGWIQNAGKQWVADMKDAYFKVAVGNIITVDWNVLAKLEYTMSARKSREVGKYLGQMLLTILKTDIIQPQGLHFVGHSLGAHIAGIAAKTIQAYMGQQVGRITGLDPARPLFEWPFRVDKLKRLDKSDARYVDVIHTSGGRLGFASPLGHADFYPNGGMSPQPGCKIYNSCKSPKDPNDLETLNEPNLVDVCSHGRAFRYYIESLATDKFKATQCESWRKYKRGECDGNPVESMGYYLFWATAKGTYFLETNRGAPFAKGLNKNN